MRMVPSESARLALYSRLEEVLGPQHAETLMTSLPMESAARLATRYDIDRLDDRTASRIGWKLGSMCWQAR
jgi:hypothetical protein